MKHFAGPTGIYSLLGRVVVLFAEMTESALPFPTIKRVALAPVAALFGFVEGSDTSSPPADSSIGN
jgi:hypothetical protein